ncbi:MAG: heme biosynthesis protein HemY [Pseudomonadota bacterium]|nr:MAG: heme biosynthesis protein HemY [Pseudomonadota bacterium]
MRVFIAMLAVLIGAVLLGLLANEDPGYVLIGRGYRTVEMSLALFATLAALLFGIGYLLIRSVVSTWEMPARWRRWKTRRRARKAHASSTKGLIELSQGHWAQAERALLKHARYSETPLLNYLSAARAAQKQNAPDRRDRYLSMAHSSMRGADFAVELTQAELQFAHGQQEQALATLVHLRSIAPNHPHVLYLLARVYEQLKSWGDLKDLLPSLRKHQVFNAAALTEIEKSVQSELLRIAAASHKPDNLRGSWQHVPRELRRDQDLIELYAGSLVEANLHDDAEAVLRDAIKHSWNIALVDLYGLSASGTPDKQLALAEGWLKGREHNPKLLLALGRLAVRAKLWGKARAYLEASIGAAPSSAAYRELGLLLEQLDESEAAAECFRKGLMLTEPAVQPEGIRTAPALPRAV